MAWKSITDFDPEEIAYREGVADVVDMLKEMLKEDEDFPLREAIAEVEKDFIGVEDIGTIN